MKRVLLTGGGGAIGVHMVRKLMTDTEAEVVILDSFRHRGDPEKVEYILNVYPQWRDRITVLKHDLCCPISPELSEKIGDVETVLHLAALSDVFWSVENPVYTVQNNVNSTLTMLEYARGRKLEAFVYFSTDEVYGPVAKGDAHPEWDTHRPSNPYSASKAASEDICYCYWRSYDIPLIITNTMNNFGEMQGYTKFPSMIQRKLRKGEPIDVHVCDGEIGTRFYIHSEDTADAVLYILNNMPAHHHEVGALDEPDRYHLVGSECVDNLTLVKMIAQITGEQPIVNLVDFHSGNPAHDIHYGLQDNKLRPSGWAEKVGFDGGMRRMVSWERDNE